MEACSYRMTAADVQLVLHGVYPQLQGSQCVGVLCYADLRDRAAGVFEDDCIQDDVLVAIGEKLRQGHKPWRCHVVFDIFCKEHKQGGMFNIVINVV